MTIRDKIAAFKDAVGPKAERLALSDTDAIALAAELNVGEARFPEALALGLESVAAQPARPDADDTDALIEWALAARKSRDDFWAAFDGQVVDGIEIVRRR